MRNTSETDYVIKCNHVSADGHFDSLFTREFCPGQTPPSAYLRKKMYGSFVLHCFIYQRHLRDDVCTDYAKFVQALLCRPALEFGSDGS